MGAVGTAFIPAEFLPQASGQGCLLIRQFTPVIVDLQGKAAGPATRQPERSAQGEPTRVGCAFPDRFGDQVNLGSGPVTKEGERDMQVSRRYDSKSGGASRDMPRPRLYLGSQAYRWIKCHKDPLTLLCPAAATHRVQVSGWTRPLPVGFETSLARNGRSRFEGNDSGHIAGRVPQMGRISTRRNQDEAYGASTLELFFDLVFVFAITQVSHLLLEHLTWKGALESTMIFMVVWSAWQYTVWATNELDPDRMPVRFVLLAIMLASLLMAVAIPEAFGDKGLLFAIPYVFIQLFRQGFLTFGAAGPGTLERGRSAHILTWFCFSAPFWIGGALAEGDARIYIWLIALTIEYVAPLVLYYVPWLKRVGLETWNLGSGHFTERFQLFTIIALGETIVLTGATTSGLEFNLTTALAFTAAFVSTACLWWLYFNYLSTVFERILDEAESRTAVGRDIFTYGHLPIIGGIILCAVGDEIVITHPTEYLHTAELIAVVSGPALYLLAFGPIRWKLTGGLPWRRIVGAAACILIGVFAYFAHPAALATGGLLLLALIGVITHEYFFRGNRGSDQGAEATEASRQAKA